METLIVTSIVLLALCLYFAPALVAIGKPHFAGVLVINLFFGWTLIFWVVSWIWAFTGVRRV